MKNTIYLLAITSLIACTNNPRNERQYDTNAAEMAETPGDLHRGDAETNKQAAAKAPGEFKHVEKTSLKTADEASKNELVSNDSFVSKAAEAGQAEVKLGELASQKTKNRKVKEFAEMMVKDHSATNDALLALARQKHVNIPECVSCATASQPFDNLDEKEFDQQYAKQMVADHEKAVALFTTASQSEEDADFKKFAAEKLPVLKHHLAMAKELERKVK